MDVEKLENHILLSKCILVVVISATLLAYFLKFGHLPLSDKTEAWGQFGDYLGGVMNPLVALGAFYWLASSVALQKTELSETRKALSESQKSQQQQADTALIAARIQTINIRLSSANLKLAHARGIRRDILEHLNDNSISAFGMRAKYGGDLEKVDKIILQWEGEEMMLVDMAVALTDALTPDIQREAAAV